jgi:hypothetical protein
MTGMSSPHCLKCKARWLSNMDFKAEQDNARKKVGSYILDGTLHEDLQELVTLTQLKTMQETAAHLRNAKSQFQELHKGDGTMSPVIAAIGDVISWLDKWHDEVKEDFEKNKRGTSGGEAST